MSIKAMKLGILKTDDVKAQWVEQFGEYPDMFANLLKKVDSNIEFVTYDVQLGHYPEDIDEVDAYLMTGSKSSVYEDKPWIHTLREFVKLLNEKQKKLVGICFGHQMVASSLGGKTEKSDRGWGIGVHSVDISDEPSELTKACQSFKLLVSHQDQVVIPAHGAKILAGSEFCPIAMCQIEEHILTFQGHPEFIREYSKNIMQLRRENFSDALYEQGVNSLKQETDELVVAQWIVDFINN